MTSEIWIAEDDRSLRWVMEKAISRDGIDVKSFESGEQLLSALKRNKPEIIISDIRMPGIDGLELLRRIHADQPDIPIIITTAHSDLDSAVAAYQGGAFEYLPKPFDLNELVDVARRGISFSKSKNHLHLWIRHPRLRVKLLVKPLPCRKFSGPLAGFQTLISRY